MPAPTHEQAKQIIGLSLPKAIEVLFPHCTTAQALDLAIQYKYQYVDVDQTPTPLFDNALDLLDGLKQRNKFLAVATGKGRAGLQRVWENSNTGHYFHASRCADESQSKPDPDMIDSLLSELRIEAKDAVMIGDTSYDMEMARRAGVDGIGVTYGVHEEHILLQHKPRAIVHSLAELRKLLIRS